MSVGIIPAKSLRQQDGGKQLMLRTVNDFITWFDGFVWGLPLIALIALRGVIAGETKSFIERHHFI